MFSRAACIVVFGALPVFAWATERMPTGIGIRMTIVGPAFVDAQGMTLYQRNNKGGLHIPSCPERPETVRPIENVGYNQVEEFPMRVPDAASRRSCTNKYPPLIAPAGSEPVEHWTVYRRENGVLQWAYRGKPLHRSIKDQAPGDIHGWAPNDKLVQQTGWGIAEAPLAAPPGIETRLSSLGLVLTNQEGKPLYYSVGRTVPSNSWKPVVAPVAAKSQDFGAGWSIVDEKGLRQWAWNGKTLYVYDDDTGDMRGPDATPNRFVDVFGGTYGKPIAGWHVALLRAAAAAPSGLQIKSIYPQYGRTTKIYADKQGKTVYAIHCAELTADGLDCDDVGDSPRYWLSFCGGEDRCGRDWQPVIAPKDASPIDGLWSVSVINPAHPFKPLREGQRGVSVWTYRGRPVFTFEDDLSSQEASGQFDMFSTLMTAVPIYAFAAPK